MKTVGIIGGMGPFATLDFFKKILESSHVELDQEHLHIFIDNNSQIPDRTSYIMGAGIDPYPFILESAKKLIMIGCTLLCMPCNTAHYWADILKNDIDGKAIFIDMIETVKEYIQLKYGTNTRIFVMGTNGLITSKLYDKYFGDSMLLYPGTSLQDEIMSLIMQIKAGKLTELANIFNKLIFKLKEYNPDVIIAACTEIPLILPYVNSDIEILDTNLLLAKKVVKEAYERI
jgi:aspartate racemase